MDIVDFCCCIERKVYKDSSIKNKSKDILQKKQKNYDIYENEEVRYSKIQFSEDTNSSILNSKNWEVVNVDDCIICMKPTIVNGGVITCIYCKQTKILAHKKCSDEWIKNSGLCVVCRRNSLSITL